MAIPCSEIRTRCRQKTGAPVRVNVLYYMPDRRGHERQFAHVFMVDKRPYSFDLLMKISIVECEKMSCQMA
jgi:hypothetical protein